MALKTPVNISPSLFNLLPKRLSPAPQPTPPSQPSAPTDPTDPGMDGLGELNSLLLNLPKKPPAAAKPAKTAQSPVGDILGELQSMLDEVMQAKAGAKAIEKRRTDLKMMVDALARLENLPSTPDRNVQIAGLKTGINECEAEIQAWERLHQWETLGYCRLWEVSSCICGGRYAMLVGMLEKLRLRKGTAIRWAKPATPSLIPQDKILVGEELKVTRQVYHCQDCTPFPDSLRVQVVESIHDLKEYLK